MARRRRKSKTKTKSMLLRSADFIGWALGGLEREIAQTKERLSALTAQASALRSRVGIAVGRSAAATGSPAARRRRRSRMTPEGRKRISEMMKRRWQEAKKKNRNRL